jgi:hypothetical protein
LRIVDQTAPVTIPVSPPTVVMTLPTTPPSGPPTLPIDRGSAPVIPETVPVMSVRFGIRPRPPGAPARRRSFR